MDNFPIAGWCKVALTQYIYQLRADLAALETEVASLRSAQLRQPAIAHEVEKLIGLVVYHKESTVDTKESARRLERLIGEQQQAGG